MLHGHESVTKLQHHLAEIYADQNQTIEIEVILTRMLESAAEVTSPFGLEEGGHAPFLKTLSWFFAFCNSPTIGIDIEPIVIQRYPELCPKCKHPVCFCERTYGVTGRARHFAGTSDENFRLKGERLVSASKFAAGEAPIYNLSWFAKTLSDIYLVNLARWKVNRYYFPTKLLRETGKLANGYRIFHNADDGADKDQAKARLEKDAADFFAWLVAYWHLSASELAGPGLQERFVNQYGDGCPYCHQMKCACPSTMTRGNRARIASLDDLDPNEDNRQRIEQLIEEIIYSLDRYPGLAQKYRLELRQTHIRGQKIKSIIDDMLQVVGKIDSSSTNVENLVVKAGRLLHIVDRFLP